MVDDLLVVGGGPAGLAHAFWAKRGDASRTVRVLEATGRAGGLVRTIPLDGGLHGEYGPQGIRPNDAFEELARALGIEGEIVAADPAAKIRWLGRGGQLIPFPMSPKDALRSPLLSLLGKLRVVTEPFVRSRSAPDESVREFLSRRFGRAVAPVAQAVIGGIYAGDTDRLEVKSAFPALLEFESEHGSVLRGLGARRKQRRGAPKRPVLCTMHGGMERLCGALASALGDSLELGRRVARIERAGRAWVVTTDDGGELRAQSVVLATPPRHTAEIVEGLDPELAAELRTIPCASVANVYLGYRRQDAARFPCLRGFGFLLEPGEDSPVLGTLYPTSVVPGSAPADSGLLRVMAGGARHPDFVDLDDAETARIATECIRRYTGFDGALDVLGVTRARRALPQYERGHGARLQRIEELLQERHPTLWLRGCSYRGLALTEQLGEPARTDRESGIA